MLLRAFTKQYLLCTMLAVFVVHGLVVVELDAGGSVHKLSSMQCVSGQRKRVVELVRDCCG